MSKVPGVPLPARRAGGVRGIGHEACRQWDLSGYILSPQGPLGIRFLGWELAQHLKVLVGLQTCVDRAALSHSRQEGILGHGRAGVQGCRRLTSVVGYVGLDQVSAGHKRWLGLAEVLDELGLGHGGQHGAGALLHAGVCEQLRRGAPIGVPHPVAQLRVEAGIAAEARGRGRAPPAGVDLACGPQRRASTRLQSAVTAAPPSGSGARVGSSGQAPRTGLASGRGAASSSPLSASHFPARVER